MKLPIFHRYFSVNTIICITTILVLLSFLLILLFPIFANFYYLFILIAFSVIAYYFIVSFCILLIPLEFYLRKTGRIIKTNVVNIPVKFQKYTYIVTIFIYVLLTAITAVFLLSNNSINTKNLKDYKKCLNSVKYKKDTFHFPKTIPNNAEDAKLYCFTSDYNGEYVFLLLKTNEEYINRELKSHKFINSKDKIGDYQQIYHMPSETVGIKNTELTYYVLDNEENKNYYKSYFPYFNGIGVDKNLEHIFYYYITPAD